MIVERTLTVHSVALPFEVIQHGAAERFSPPHRRIVAGDAMTSIEVLATDDVLTQVRPGDIITITITKETP